MLVEQSILTYKINIAIKANIHDFLIENQKFIVGPHFCLTKLCLTKVRKDGVLKKKESKTWIYKVPTKYDV
jgi:hypothetical protein